MSSSIIGCVLRLQTVFYEMAASVCLGGFMYIMLWSHWQVLRPRIQMLSLRIIQSCMVIISYTTNLAFLANTAGRIFIDGTFNSHPNFCFQLYMDYVMGIIFHKCVPSCQDNLGRSTKVCDWHLFHLECATWSPSDTWRFSICHTHCYERHVSNRSHQMLHISFRAGISATRRKVERDRTEYAMSQHIYLVSNKQTQVYEVFK